MTGPLHHLSPVPPAVTAELVDALTPRLRKRLDAAVAKLATRPVTVDGDTIRIAVDDETTLELDAPNGTVASADAIRCGCLLAPDCVHRAAAASLAPVAEADTETAAPARPPEQPEQHPASGPKAPAADQLAAAEALWTAGATALEAGADGAGAVAQAELLRAAHTARLAGLPRPASAAVRTVTLLRAARDARPEYRLTDLTAALRELLATAHALRRPAPPARVAELRGTSRRTYEDGGSLRLFGLCTEPVLTASGHAGAVTWVADAQGGLYTVPDVAPGGPSRAMGAASRTVRIGDTALTHRELARAGLVVSGATLSADGRLGAGQGVRAVRAKGAGWDEDPLAALWAAPPFRQVARALQGARNPGGGHELLFLDVTLRGAVHEAGGDCLLADCDGRDGPPLRLRITAAHDHPELPYRDNLRLLASVAGLRIRIIGRLEPAAHPRLRLLAAELPGGRYDMGLDRLQRSDIPAAGPVADTAAPRPLPIPLAPTPDSAPLHVLTRRTGQAAAAGRRALGLAGAESAPDAARLRRAGLATAAELLDELLRTAAERGRDTFGRLLATDTGSFARAWLAAVLYTEEVAAELCRAAWRDTGETREYGG
ncbi:hypothetical protein [Streptomyces sp. NPDC002889]|uniref:hypothetical protein n=1 Tax=Streptomyces sp. NPDC002889 TaxID=3364669 RepID=UPI00367CA0DD